MRGFFTSIAKISFSVFIIAYLSYQAWKDKSLEQLIEQPKHWGFLTLALVCALVIVVLQIVRWVTLSHAIHLKIGWGEALRVGFISQLFSLLSFGMVAGDAVKIYYLHKENKGRILETTVSGFVDRLVGLFGLLVIASACTFLIDIDAMLSRASETEASTIRSLCAFFRWLALGGILGVVFFLIPGVVDSSIWNPLERTPVVGGAFKRLMQAVRIYRSKLGALATCLLFTSGVHIGGAVMIYCLARGIPAPVSIPSFGSHVVVALLSLASNALPLGVFELAFNTLYQGIAPEGMPKQQGFLIVLAFRLVQSIIGGIGLVCYLRGRKEIDAALSEADFAKDGEGEPARAVEADSV